MDLTTLRERFRDDAQRQAVGEVVQDRLADDRAQTECRYLMRFWWQLSMPYVEVTLPQLEEHLRPERFAIIVALIDAIDLGHHAIDAWVERTMRTMPVIEDRGYALSQDASERED